jgi:hypothetical protein
MVNYNGNFPKSPFTLLERIEQKIMTEPNSGCWLWIGSVGSHGYAQIGVESGTTIVHRILYEKAYGAIPKGLECDHLCRVRCCVNPDHIELVTRRENIKRGFSPCAKQMLQRHCKRGHPLFGDNLITYKTKYGIARRCKLCRSLQPSQSKEAKRFRAQRAYKIRRGVS